MASAVVLVIWIMRLLEEIGVANIKPITLNCDNQFAIYIAKNPIYHKLTKHISIDCYFTREKVLEGLIQFSYLPTTHQLADILTKVLPWSKFQVLLCKLGLISILPSLRGGVANTTKHQHVSSKPRFKNYTDSN